MDNPEEIRVGGETVALIVKSSVSGQGIRFFTPDTYSQQLGYLEHPAGKVIPPHVHNQVKREVYYTQEVLVLRKGRLRVDFFSDAQIYFCSRVLEAGDVVLLIKGGHGFEVLEDVEMFEIKQGPYAGTEDKTRFLWEAPKKGLNYE